MNFHTAEVELFRYQANESITQYLLQHYNNNIIIIVVMLQSILSVDYFMSKYINISSKK